VLDSDEKHEMNKCGEKNWNELLEIGEMVKFVKTNHESFFLTFVVGNFRL